MSNRLVDVCVNFWPGPVGDSLSRFARWFMHAPVQSVSRIIEMDYGLQTFYVAVMHIRLHESRIRPQVYVATGWGLNFAVELGREWHPGRVWVCPKTYTLRRLTKLHREAEVDEETANS